MKATEIQICIFSWLKTDGSDGKNYAGFESWPEPERSVGFQVGEAIARASLKNANLPISYWGICSLADADVGVDNQKVVIDNGINPQNLPAVQIWASYPNGKIISYLLGKDVISNLISPITTENIQDRIQQLLTYKRPQKGGVLCQILPIACQIPRLMWLAGAVVSGYNVSQTQGLKKTAWLASAGVCTEEFFANGGFTDLVPKK
ncbi:MAG: hypothetical protein ACRC78_04155 [Planktothrix sp.]